jgi:hypothetical protein
MKKLLYLYIILTFSFSCKKAEVRKDIEGSWTLDAYICHCNSPYQYSSGGTDIYDFGNCSRKMNKKNSCVLTVNAGEETSYQIIEKGKIIVIDDRTYKVNLRENTLKLEWVEGNSYNSYLGTYTFIRN